MHDCNAGEDEEQSVSAGIFYLDNGPGWETDDPGQLVGLVDSDELAAEMVRRWNLVGGNSCLLNAAEGEPVFILRGQDIVAPRTVEHWATVVEQRGAPRGKWEDALSVARAMRSWQAEHTTKVPD